MKNLKIIKKNDLKDWAEELFQKNSYNMVEKFHEAHGCQQISVAGGIDPEKIRNLKSCQPEILVVGSYITTAVDPSKAVKTIRQVMNEISV